jgi:hypothetical protein
MSAQRIYVNTFQRNTEVKFYWNGETHALNLKIMPFILQNRVLQALIVAQMVKNKRGVD